MLSWLHREPGARPEPGDRQGGGGGAHQRGGGLGGAQPPPLCAARADLRGARSAVGGRGEWPGGGRGEGGRYGMVYGPGVPSLHW